MHLLQPFDLVRCLFELDPDELQFLYSATNHNRGAATELTSEERTCTATEQLGFLPASLGHSSSAAPVRPGHQYKQTAFLFHFACVGLFTKPTGKWFCPDCKEKMKKAKKKSDAFTLQSGMMVKAICFTPDFPAVGALLGLVHCTI